MSRIRALKNRADFRKGGYVDRKKFQGGGFGLPAGHTAALGGFTNTATGEFISYMDYLASLQGTATTGAETGDQGEGQGEDDTTTTIDESDTVQPDTEVVVEGEGEGDTTTVDEDDTTTVDEGGGQGEGGGDVLRQTTDRTFGARTTDEAPAVGIRTKLGDSTIQTKEAVQIADRTTAGTGEDVTTTEIKAAESDIGQAEGQTLSIDQERQLANLSALQANQGKRDADGNLFRELTGAEKTELWNLQQTKKRTEVAQMEATKVGEEVTTKAAQGEVTRVAEAEALTLSVEQKRQLANLSALQANQGKPGVRELTGAEKTELWNLQTKKEGIEARKVQTAQRDTASEQDALVQDQTLEVGQDAFVQRVVGEQVDVVQTTPAEKNTREATLGMPAPSGTEAQIINEFGFGSSKNRVLRGPEAKAAAAGRLVSEHGVSQQVAESILQDVGELVTNIDGVSQESLGAIASLPKEALVSSQMESLLAGMEEGKTPLWARPAVALIEERLAERGLEASSVGRDALFNSIIQSALPIAQSNAQALQQRASQNLSNEQQALIQDRQVAADFLVKNAAFKQNMDLANLSNDQQMRLANLTAQNQAGSENLSAAQQTEFANLNSRLQSNLLQAKLAQEMGVAQLSVDQQTAMNNASLNANIDFTNYTTAQQNALANSKFMQTMTLTDFNARQQSAMQNATTIASMDLATADHNMKLSITNAQNFLQMDMANLSNEQQAVLVDQQLMQQRLLSNQSAENASKQFNATSINQTNQFMANLGQQLNIFNTTQLNAMNQFNTSEANRIAAINAQNDLDADKFNSQAQQQVNLFDADLAFKTDQWNAQNAQAVEQSNIAWRRKSNTMDTAAQNESNKMAAQFSFNMSMAEQNYMWQELRDKAAFAQQTSESTSERMMTVLSAIYGNAELMTYKKHSHARDTLAPKIERLLGLA